VRNTDPVDISLVKEVLSPTRLLILLELSAGEKSLTELARSLGLSPSTIHYHLTKLSKLGLVRTTRTERVGNLVVKYYGVIEDLNVLEAGKLPKSVSKRVIIPCLAAFLAKALEMAVRRRGATGFAKLLVLNLDREQVERINEEVSKVLELARSLSEHAERGDTVMLLSIVTMAQPGKEGGAGRLEDGPAAPRKTRHA